MFKFHQIFIYFLALIAGNTAMAESDAKNVLYLGAGPTDESGAFATDDIPYALGFINMSESRATVLGFDFAGEGAMFDSTGGGDRVRQAMSFNALIGTNVYQGSDMRIDALALIGARESISDCPDSYLGYQCYADMAPHTEYDLNYGAVVTATFDRFMVGARSTTESTQIVLGFQF